MKKIYLFVTAISFAATGVAQLVTYPTKTQKTQYELASPEQLNAIANRPATMQERAAGDVIWETSFDYSANWTTTVTSGTANATHNWLIGADDTWFFPGINSSSGAPYATCVNGDPSASPATHYSGGSFILELDSVFDLSSYNNVLFEFEQYGARFNDDQYFEISTNGGTVWTPVYSNEEIPGMYWGAGESYNDPHFIQFDITDAIAGNPANVRIRFHLTWDVAITSPGITYGWYIDDIKMREAYDYDVELVDPYILVGDGIAVSQLPTMQPMDITFTATVQNNGNLNLTGVDFTANCTTAGFTGTSGGSALLAGDKDSLVVSTVFPAPSTTGNKALTFSIDATETLDNTYNDAASATLKITNNIMAADWYDGTEASITSSFFGWSAPSGSTTTIGNVMNVSTDGGISGVRVGVRDYHNVNNSEGNTLIVEIWKYDGSAWGLENTYEDYIVDASDIGTLAEIMFDEPMEVFAGDVLYVGAGWYNGSDVPIMMAGESPIGSVMATDGGDLFTLGDPDPTETNMGAPVVRAIFIDNIGVEEIAANDFTVGQNIPNPFSANSTINYTLTEAAYVTVSFTDVTGKVVKTITPGNVDAGTYTMTVDGSDMAEGVYFYTFTAGDNKITKQMVVSKN